MSVVEAKTETDVPAELRAAALALNPAQRDSLALDLILSVLEFDEEPEPGYDEAWAAELDRRLRSIEDGTAKLIPWEEVKARLGKRPAEVRP